MPSVRGFIAWLRESFEKRRMKGAPAAKDIRELLNEMAPEFQFEQMDEDVENPNEIQKDKLHSPVDYKILYKKKLVWYMDVTRQPTYSYKEAGDNNIRISIPKVSFGKGELVFGHFKINGDLDVYLVYDLAKDLSITLGERCIWITIKKALHYGEWGDTNRTNASQQTNLEVHKTHWNQGLESLVQEWRKRIEN